MYRKKALRCELRCLRLRVGHAIEKPSTTLCAVAALKGVTQLMRLYCFVTSKRKFNPEHGSFGVGSLLVPGLTWGAGRRVSLSDATSMTHLHPSLRLWRLKNY